MDSDELCDALILWVAKFELEIPHQNSSCFYDGVVVANILHKIDNEYFTVSWLGRIKKDVGENTRLKINNVKKVLNQMMEYFKEVCNVKLVGYDLPNVQLICEKGDVKTVSKFLQLLLFLAINSPQKNDFVQFILQLEFEPQELLKEAIQDMMQYCQSTLEEDDPEEQYQQEMKNLQDQLQDAVSEKEEMAQRCHVLDMQVAMLQEEKMALEVEKEQILSNSQMEAESETKSSTMIRHNQMLVQIDELQEETYKLEAQTDEYKLKCEVLEQDLQESQIKNIQLQQLAEDSKKLKDEVDYLQAERDRAVRLEDLVSTYKDRLKEFNELRQQLKISEDKNTEYMGKIVNLEDDLKKAEVTKTQLENNTRKLIDTQTKLTEETRKSSKAEFEVQNKIEMIKTLQAEKERLQAERNSLRQTNEDLQLAHSGGQNMSGFLGDQMVESAEQSQENQIMLKEKIIRLEHENKMLKLEQENLGGEKIESLSTEIEKSSSKINELETENKISKQRNDELKEQIAELQKQMQQQANSDDENAALRRKVTEHLVKLKQTEEELQRKKKYIETMESQMNQEEKIVNELKEQLKQKDQERVKMEERYKNYLEKAKKVIRNLDPNKNQQNLNPQLTKLKMELADKDKIIKQLEKEHLKVNQARDSEEKNIVNAWYNLGMQLHRKAVDDRLSQTNPGQSFLARQRQASSNRRSNNQQVNRKEKKEEKSQWRKTQQTLASWTYM